MFHLLFAFLAPHECLGCGREGHLLCDACARRSRPATGRCYYCQRQSPGGLTCAHCQKRSPLQSVQAVLRYEALAQQLIWCLKFQHSRAAATDMAHLLAPLLANVPGPLYITHAPTAPSRIRARGYDQAQLIARQLARHIPQATYLPLVARHGRHRQVGTDRAHRFQQQAHAFRPNCQLPPDSQVVIIDDVITTGATLEAVAWALHQAGARRIAALTFAQA